MNDDWCKVSQSLPPEAKSVRGAWLDGDKIAKFERVYQVGERWFNAITRQPLPTPPDLWQTIGPPTYRVTE